MNKKTQFVALVVLVILVLGTVYFFFGLGEKETSSETNSGLVRPIAQNEQQSSEPLNAEASNDDHPSEELPAHIKRYPDILKAHLPVTIDELDHNEQLVVNFLIDYFNVSKEDTQESFEARVHKHIHPISSTTEYEQFGFYYAEGRNHPFPVFKEGKESTLTMIALLPEYISQAKAFNSKDPKFEGKDTYVVPVSIYYIEDGVDMKAEYAMMVSPINFDEEPVIYYTGYDASDFPWVKQEKNRIIREFQKSMAESATSTSQIDGDVTSSRDYKPDDSLYSNDPVATQDAWMNYSNQVVNTIPTIVR